MALREVELTEKIELIINRLIFDIGRGMKVVPATPVLLLMYETLVGMRKQVPVSDRDAKWLGALFNEMADEDAWHRLGFTHSELSQLGEFFNRLANSSKVRH